MRIFTEEQYELFKQVATLSQDGLHKAMKAYLRAMYGRDKVVSSKDYVYAKRRYTYRVGCSYGYCS